MKKFVNTLILSIFLFCCFPLIAFAAGSITVSTASLSITQGYNKTFTITANHAAGRVNISSSNPGVASVSESSIFLDSDGTPSKSITVVGNSVGTATITVTLADAATYDEEVLSNQYQIYVEVKEKAVTPVEPPTPSTPNVPSNPPAQTTEDTRSANANLKSLRVEDYELKTTDKIHYTLSVKNSVDTITIVAVAEDSNAKITGAGKVNLLVGDNSFDIVVTAENGTVKKYSLIVTRKNNVYYVETLADALADDEAIVQLKENDILTVDDLNKIKSSRKQIDFVRYGSDNRKLYSWTYNGSLIQNPTNNMNTNISFDFGEDQNAFDEKIEYRNGVYLNFAQKGKFLTPNTISVYVGDKFSDSDTVHLYYYNKENGEVTLMEKNLIVSNGMVQFSLEKGSMYFVTKSLIGTGNTTEATTTGEEHNYTVYFIVGIIILLVLLVIVLILLFKRISEDKKNNKEKDNNNVKVEVI